MIQSTLILVNFHVDHNFCIHRQDRKEAPALPLGPRATNDKEMNLGLLVIIIDDFPNELLWRLWLGENITSDDITLGSYAVDIDSNKDEGGGDKGLDSCSSGNSVVASRRYDKVKFWFHAKFPDRVRSSWVRRRLVKGFQFKPSWGSVELTKVMGCMLKEVRP